MNTRDLQQAIVDRLKAEFVGWDVDGFPDAVERYQFSSKSKALLVQPERSTYGEVLSFDPFSVERTLQITISIYVRSLRRADGAFAANDRIRKALFGWEPATKPTVDGEAWVKLGCTHLRPVSDTEFVAEDNGQWQFIATYQTTTIEVALGLEPEELGPAITDVEQEDAA